MDVLPIQETHWLRSMPLVQQGLCTPVVMMSNSRWNGTVISQLADELRGNAALFQPADWPAEPLDGLNGRAMEKQQFYLCTATLDFGWVKSVSATEH